MVSVSPSLASGPRAVSGFGVEGGGRTASERGGERVSPRLGG